MATHAAKRVLRARNPRCRGQALVEAAIIFPLLLLLLLGVEEVGRLAYTAIVTSHAAHAGAMYGAQNDVTVVDNAGMVQAAVGDGGEVSSLSASASHACTCADGGSAPDCSLSDCSGSRLQVYAEVTTTATFTPICSFLGWPSPVTVQGQAAIRAVQ